MNISFEVQRSFHRYDQEIRWAHVCNICTKMLKLSLTKFTKLLSFKLHALITQTNEMANASTIPIIKSQGRSQEPYNPTTLTVKRATKL